jgi:glycosyltransferase involved in cell wall biosynthesis
MKVGDRDYPLVTIITVVRNNVEFIRDTIESVLSQDYPNVEYVVIDGESTDGTVEIVKEYAQKISFILSEPDKGIYDALNKGIKKSKGSVIGILHSDDLFYDNHVISEMIHKMEEDKTELCFSDLIILDRNTEKILRFYMSHYFKRWLFRIGWLPPHPTCFISRALFDEFGLYSTNYKIAGDFDFLVRIFFGKKIRWSYVNRVTVKMHIGGQSNSGWHSKRMCAKEINISLHENHVWSLPIFQVLRYIIRFWEMVVRPKQEKV